MKIESKQKGFTLIELMIVVAIIGILASIAIPQFAQFRVKAFDAAGSADLKNGTTAIEAVYADTYAYPTNTDNTVTSGAMAWTSTLSWSASNGVLIGHKGTASTYALAAKHKGGQYVYQKTRTGQHTEATIANVGEGVDMTAANIPTAN